MKLNERDIRNIIRGVIRESVFDDAYTKYDNTLKQFEMGDGEIDDDSPLNFKKFNDYDRKGFKSGWDSCCIELKSYLSSNIKNYTSDQLQLVQDIFEFLKESY